MTSTSSVRLVKAVSEIDRSELAEHSAAAKCERADIQRLFPLDGWPPLELERYAPGQYRKATRTAAGSSSSRLISAASAAVRR